MAVWLLFKKYRKPPELFYEKAVLLKTWHYSQDEQENTCVGFLFIQSIAKFLRAPILKNICFWKYFHETEKNKICLKSFNFTLKNCFFQHQYQEQVKMLVFISWLVSHETCIHNISLVCLQVNSKGSKYL